MLLSPFLYPFCPPAVPKLMGHLPTPLPHLPFQVSVLFACERVAHSAPFLRSSEKSWKLRPIKWTCSCFRVWLQSNLH
jgi:hypothetical protein